MKDTDVSRLFTALRAAGLRFRARRHTSLAPAAEAGLRARHWRAAAGVLREQGWRLSALWVEEHARSLVLTLLAEHGGAYLALRTRAPAAMPTVPSIAGVFPAADRMERHAHDLFGLCFEGQPDARRWTRHQAWSAEQFPLRREFPLAGRPLEVTPPDRDYPCAVARGAGVHEIPVGPVHAGVIEPGHFRFLAVGEEVLNLEERLGYVHKGIEKIACDRDPAGLARLAARVSGDSAAAHGWAACMAMERAAVTAAM